MTVLFFSEVDCGAMGLAAQHQLLVESLEDGLLHAVLHSLLFTPQFLGNWGLQTGQGQAQPLPYIRGSALVCLLTSIKAIAIDLCWALARVSFYVATSLKHGFDPMWCKSVTEQWLCLIDPWKDFLLRGWSNSLQAADGLSGCQTGDRQFGRVDRAMAAAPRASKYAWPHWLHQCRLPARPRHLEPNRRRHVSSVWFQAPLCMPPAVRLFVEGSRALGKCSLCALLAAHSAEEGQEG